MPTTTPPSELVDDYRLRLGTALTALERRYGVAAVDRHIERINAWSERADIALDRHIDAHGHIPTQAVDLDGVWRDAFWEQMRAAGLVDSPPPPRPPWHIHPEGAWFELEGNAVRVFSNLAGDAAGFAAAIDQTTGPEIRLLINSSGGNVGTALTAASVLNRRRADGRHVVAIVDGRCLSAATLLLGAADWRILDPRAWIMVHDAHPDPDRTTSDRIAATYAARTGRGTAQSWRAAMKAGTWYSALDAVAAGLADTIRPGAGR